MGEQPTSADLSIETPIHRRFETLADRHPHRLAASDCHQSITYDGLNQFANRVAHAILSSRDAREEPVVILAQQGIPVLAYILGCLKASKIYVPLPPDPPAALLQSLQPALVLSSGPHPSFDCPVLVADPATLDRFPSTNPNLPSSADRMAYIYYTSGSTGEPKGVVDIHRNVVHNILRYTNTLHITRDDRLTLLQTPAFSGAVSSMFCALLNGAAVFPLDPRHESGPSLARWVRENRLTMWHSVPSLFRQLCSAGGEFPSVRVIRLEGDSAALADVHLFRRHFPRTCVLVNGLGATETGISRQFFVTHDTPLEGNLLPIGYAVPDMHVTVLPETGEIAVQSRFLAIGYWRRPDLTARAFSDCGDGSRVYRTGDLGRFRPDGCLEHLGRLDSRVKVRGQWVDLAVVEAQLQCAPGVANCALRLDATAGGEHRLVAFLVPLPDYRPTANALRAWLRGKLDTHEIPAAFIFLERLPLNANGKVDRKALPLPDRRRPELDTVFVPPRTPAEQRVAAAFLQALDLDAAGIDDDFFDLGGDSLSAARLAAALHLDAVQLIQAPTIRRLAHLLDAPAQPSAGDLLCFLRPPNGQPPLFCIPGHTGALVGYRQLAQHLPSTQPVAAFLPPPAGSYTLAELASWYAGELQRIQPNGPVFLTGLCFGGCVAYEMACQLTAQGRTVQSLILLECFNSRWLASQSLPARLRAQAGLAARRAAFHALAVLRLLPRGAWDHIRRRVEALAAARHEALLQQQFDRIAQSGQPIPPECREPAFANRAAERAWTPQPYPGRVLLIAGAEPRAGQYYAPLLGWATLLCGPATCLLIPDHLHGVLAKPTVHRVAQHLLEEIGSPSRPAC